MMGRKIHVLGIESSCDDTGIAILDQDEKILSNCIHSQLEQHISHGGIIPMMAKEYHMQNIDRIARQAFEQSRLKSMKDVSAIAVTNRPGLRYSLRVGLNYAKTLSKRHSKPLIPIHHMQAHALMPLLQNRSIRFPFIALLISGGHCILSIAKRYNDFHILGSTKDEAPGDLLDKVARRFRLRNLGEPFDRISGGASIELLSTRDGSDRFKYFHTQRGVPMMRKNSCDFSFTGYRGSIDNVATSIDELWSSGNRQNLLDELGHICASLQRVILIQLVKKFRRAFMFYRMHWRYSNENAFCNNDQTDHLGFSLLKIDDESNSVDLIVSGGVAANSYIINGLKLACADIIDKNIKVYTPDRNLCSDNGLMIAWNGMLHYRDFIEKKKTGASDCDTYSSVIYNENQIDSLDVEAQCPMGIDISDQVRLTNFELLKFSHPEFRVSSS